MNLVDKELSEPYSIFTYRYFVYLWPNLTFRVSRGQVRGHCGLQNGGAPQYLQRIHRDARCRQTLQRKRHW
ncbi:hypothetical protein KSP40_PGU004302 [Platanthera guangdongensis]|uniref:Uncharacterized protein n=1 Tax=Platanthera guangdongensis TaxID=2320717 RepID=A0ABR2LG55_9ASPA